MDQMSPSLTDDVSDAVKKRRAYHRAWKAKNRIKANAAERARYAARKERNIEHVRALRRAAKIRNRVKNEATSVVYRQRTREVARARNAAYHRKNPLAHRLNVYRWRKAHPEYGRLASHLYRARKRSLPATFTLAEQQRMMQYWHYACAVCGRQDGFSWLICADHWRALASPSSPGTIATNMIPLCHGERGCNPSKHNKDPHAWLISRVGARRARTIEKAIAAYFAWVVTQHDSASS